MPPNDLASSPERTPGAPEPAREEDRVLAVEDDSPLRDLLAEVLTAAGYRVVTARDAGETLRARDPPAPCAPDPPVRLRGRDAGAPSPLVSGYRGHEVGRDGRSGPPSAFLRESSAARDPRRRARDLRSGPEEREERGMRYRNFGSTGLVVSEVGFGAAPIGYLGTDAADVERIVRALLDAGVNLFDTAACYRESETALGEALRGRRDDVVLVTKCGHPADDLEGAEWSGELVRRSVDRSLRRLGTDRIDVVLLHSCDLETLRRGEALGALAEARAAGKVRFAGYSGDDEAAAYAAALPEVAVLEVSVNLCDQSNLREVLPAARERGLGVIAKRPLANAAWRRPEEQRGIYADYASTYRRRLESMALAPGDLGMAGDPAETWPELALRFTLSQPGVHSAILGTTSAAHVSANLAAAGKGPLDERTLAAIGEVYRRAESAAGERWTGQT